VPETCGKTDCLQHEEGKGASGVLRLHLHCGWREGWEGTEKVQQPAQTTWVG